jgi:hypothetical protein
LEANEEGNGEVNEVDARGERAETARIERGVPTSYRFFQTSFEASFSTRAMSMSS